VLVILELKGKLDLDLVGEPESVDVKEGVIDVVIVELECVACVAEDDRLDVTEAERV